jgi:hypothetical protein
MFWSEHWKPFLQEAAVESGIMSDDEHYAAQQIVYGTLINSATGDHFIGNAGDLRDFSGDREAGIFKPLPRAMDFIDLPAFPVVFEKANPEFDNSVALGIARTTTG